MPAATPDDEVVVWVVVTLFGVIVVSWPSENVVVIGVVTPLDRVILPSVLDMMV